ncbi:hypothetical protein BDV25DRAFT_158337 [Aspergillus avenaceus]|uniref:Uncharacterized protein n=1 Tax=Aspergillus avenaceus TaxID=36643 RepID=A0A5N6TQ05_ASPAV|nr:hypothetical protein BDV25DRAFT_158337 [Aspergillus avenaceus]
MLWIRAGEPLRLPRWSGCSTVLCKYLCSVVFFLSFLFCMTIVSIDFPYIYTSTVSVLSC